MLSMELTFGTGSHSASIALSCVISRYANYRYGIVMPVAAALLKFALFALWAHPTYKSTVEMLEIRERRLGFLPENADTVSDLENADTAADNTSAEAVRKPAAKPPKSAPVKKARITPQKQTRTT